MQNAFVVIFNCTATSPLLPKEESKWAPSSNHQKLELSTSHPLSPCTFWITSCSSPIQRPVQHPRAPDHPFEPLRRRPPSHEHSRQRPLRRLRLRAKSIHHPRPGLRELPSARLLRQQRGESYVKALFHTYLPANLPPFLPRSSPLIYLLPSPRSIPSHAPHSLAPRAPRLVPLPHLRTLPGRNAPLDPTDVPHALSPPRIASVRR